LRNPEDRKRVPAWVWVLAVLGFESKECADRAESRSYPLDYPLSRRLRSGLSRPKFPALQKILRDHRHLNRGVHPGSRRGRSGTLAEVLAVNMGRQGRAPGVQFAVKVRELAAGIFQE